MKRLAPLFAFACAILLTVGCSGTSSVLDSPASSPPPATVQTPPPPTPAHSPADAPMIEITDDR